MGMGLLFEALKTSGDQTELSDCGNALNTAELLALKWLLLRYVNFTSKIKENSKLNETI